MQKVSIILPVYNGEEYLKQAINSVLVQSFSDWELIIVNDGSTDGSAKIIEWYMGQDKRIRQITNEVNMGLVASLNEGAAAASGEYLARIDSDDFWSEPTKLEKQVAFLQTNPGHALVGTWAKMVDESGKRKRDFRPPATDRKIRNQILWHNCFLHSSVLIRKSIFLQAGGYKKDERHVEDYGLWLRVGKLAQFANLPEVMVTYRVMPGGVTKTKNVEQLSRILELIEKFKNDYPGHWKGFIKWRLQKLFS